MRSIFQPEKGNPRLNQALADTEYWVQPQTSFSIKWLQHQMEWSSSSYCR